MAPESKNPTDYAALFGALSQGVVCQDASGRIISANPAAARVLGLPMSQLLGRDFADSRWRTVREDGSPMPASEHPSMLALASGRLVGDTVMGVYSPEDRDYRWIRVQAFPGVRPGEDRPFQVCSTFEDITGQKRTEAARQESERRFQNIVRASPMGIHMFEARGADLVFVGANPAADAILGADHGKLVGRTIGEAFPGLAGTDIPGRYLKAAREGESWHGEQVAYKDAAVSGVFDIHVFQTAPGAAAVMFADMSERMRMSENLQKKIDELGALYVMSMEVGSSLSVDEVKAKAFQAVVAAVSPDLAFLFTSQDEHLELTKFHSTDPAVGPDSFEAGKVGRCLCGQAIAEKGGVYSSDSLFDARCSEPECRKAGIRSYAVMPLYAGGEQFGALAVASFSPRDFTSEKVFLESISGIFSASLRNAMLHESLGRSVQELERSREMLRRILDAMPFGVAIVGQDRRVREANRAALRILGYRKAGDLVGQPCKDALCTRRRPECPIIDLGKTVDRTECEITARDGRKAPILKSAIQVELGGESVMIETFVDITEMRRAKEELEKARDELEARVAERTRELSEANARLTELDRLKSAFMSTVSHDLRTPLTSVLGFAKIIRREFSRRFAPLAAGDASLEDRARQIEGNLDIVTQEGERLTRLINDFLDLTRIEEGRYTWQDAPVDMGALVEEAVSSVSGVFLQKPAVTLEVEVTDSLPVLRLDPDRLTQVLVNLLSNAAKFTQQGRVVVSALPTPDSVRVSVTDSGVGIPATELKRVFDKFYQVGSDTLQAVKGTGLGLAISKQIVEHYGGSIWAESEPGRGSTFSFDLPLTLAAR